MSRFYAIQYGVMAATGAFLLWLCAAAFSQPTNCPPVGSCGGISAIVEPMPPQDLGDGVVLMHINDFQVQLSWSAAANLDCDIYEGYYDPWANNPSWGSYRYKPADLWNNRNTSYTWYVFGGKVNGPDPIGCAWQFRVRGENADNQGPFVETSVFLPGPMGAATNLTAASSNGSVTLSWNAPGQRAGENGTTFPVQGYRIYRNKEGTSTDSLFATVSGTATSWEDQSVTSGKTYYYTVYPYDQYGFGSSIMESATAQGGSSTAETKKKSGCGAGSLFAFIPPIFFFARSRLGRLNRR
jgi:hypothetical protein